MGKFSLIAEELMGFWQPAKNKKEVKTQKNNGGLGQRIKKEKPWTATTLLFQDLQERKENNQIQEIPLP